MTRDMVNSPPHYTQAGIECIEAIEAATVGKSGFEGALVANVIKYLWRYEAKNGLQDVQKARWYVERLAAHLEAIASPMAAAEAQGLPSAQRLADAEDIIIWPPEERIDVIGSNGNGGEHYRCPQCLSCERKP